MTPHQRPRHRAAATPPPPRRRQKVSQPYRLPSPPPPPEPPRRPPHRRHTPSSDGPVTNAISSLPKDDNGILLDRKGGRPVARLPITAWREVTATINRAYAAAHDYDFYYAQV